MSPNELSHYTTISPSNTMVTVDTLSPCIEVRPQCVTRICLSSDRLWRIVWMWRELMWRGRWWSGNWRVQWLQSSSPHPSFHHACRHDSHRVRLSAASLVLDDHEHEHRTSGAADSYTASSFVCRSLCYVMLLQPSAVDVDSARIQFWLMTPSQWRQKLFQSGGLVEAEDRERARGLAWLENPMFYYFFSF